MTAPAGPAQETSKTPERAGAMHKTLETCSCTCTCIKKFPIQLTTVLIDTIDTPVSSKTSQAQAQASVSVTKAMEAKRIKRGCLETLQNFQ